jgi:hypothetical protein
MKEYIKSRIIMTLEAIVLVVIAFSLNKGSFVESSRLIAMNENLDKAVDKAVIVKSQESLYEKGIFAPIYTFKGELTGYAGDCALCSGYLACPPRTNVLKEGIYFNDKTYGTIRIVASSKNYPCGTILKFNVNKLSDEPIVAIVLDRGVGGNVIDLLTENEDYAIKSVGRVKNLNFEVLREGWSK